MTRRDLLGLKFKNSKKERVVIVGSGFGGMAAAKAIHETNPNVQIIMLEKRDFFMSCPLSNAYLGGLKKVNMDILCKDFYEAANNHGYHFVNCEVTGVDRQKRLIQTSKGEVYYDYLLLAPGIAYDYKKQFPHWDDEKIRAVSQETPAALITGNEHLALKRQLDNLEEGNVIITVPEGKYRCLTSPYERATMIANYISKNRLNCKVMVLDASENPKDKAFAYINAFEILYKYTIEYYTSAPVSDVDLEKKEITVQGDKVPYAILNLIPPNKAHPLIKMAGISTDDWGGALLQGAGFRSVDDDRVYVVGDAAGHELPASAQMANWTGKRAGRQLGLRIKGSNIDETAGLPSKNAGVCYSMVCEGPQMAIMEHYDIEYNGKCLHVNEKVYKDAKGNFHSEKLAKNMHQWYANLISDTFLS